MGFTKLDDNFFDSSLVSEGPVPVAIFVLLLSKAGPDGIARVAMPVIAGRLGITREEARAGAAKLSDPDPDSRSKEFEGRRIERCDGGWRILNYFKYREMRDPDERRQQTREAMARMRARRKGEVEDPRGQRGSEPLVSQGEPLVSQCEPMLAQAEAEAEAEAEQRIPAAAPPAPPAPPPSKPVDASPDSAWSKDACDLWIAGYGGTAPGGQIGKHLRPLVVKHGWPTVRSAWRAYLESSDAQYASPARFASTYGAWAPRVPINPEPPPPAETLPAMDQGAHDLFEAMKIRLAGVLPLQSHATWLRPVFGHAWENIEKPRLLLIVPSKEHAQQMRTWADRLRKAAEELGSPGLQFRTVVVPYDLPGLHAGSIR